MLWTMSGMTLGLGAALAATQLLSGFLYGVAAADPPAFAGIPLLLGATAWMACYVPRPAAPAGSIRSRRCASSEGWSRPVIDRFPSMASHGNSGSKDGNMWLTPVVFVT